MKLMTGNRNILLLCLDEALALGHDRVSSANFEARGPLPLTMRSACQSVQSP